MTYVLINHACDGRHVRTFKTLACAQAALEAFLGRAISEFAPGQPHYTDWGNRLVIEERAAGHTASLERRLAAAFGARECGVANKSQLALLAKHGF